MNKYLQLKLALAGIGIVLLLWGLRVENPMLRWFGIAFLAASVLTRLIPKRLRDEDYPDKPEA